MNNTATSSPPMPAKQPSGGAWHMAFSMTLSGTIGLLVLTSGQSAWSVVWFRCLFGAIALLTWLTLQRGWKPMNGKALLWLLAGAMALIMNWLFLFSSYRLSGIAVATVVYHVQPFFLILLTTLIQGEPLHRHKIPWLVLALLGVTLTAGLQWGGSLKEGMLQGVAMALTAAFLYAVATLATRKLKGIAPAQIAGLQLLLGVPLLTPWANFSIASFTPTVWASLLTLGLVHTGLMYNLMYAAFQRLSAQRIAALSFIYPLVAIAMDLFGFQVIFSGTQILGISLILLAMVAHQRDWPFPGTRSNIIA